MANPGPIKRGGDVTVSGGRLEKSPTFTGPGARPHVQYGDRYYSPAAPASAKLSWADRPASIGAGLVGREHELDRLADGLARHRVFVLSGGPGTGKSRLAAEHTIRDSKGIWVDASGSPTHALASVATPFNIPQAGTSEDKLADQVVRLISELPDSLSDKGLWRRRRKFMQVEALETGPGVELRRGL